MNNQVKFLLFLSLSSLNAVVTVLAIIAGGLGALSLCVLNISRHLDK